MNPLHAATLSADAGSGGEPVSSVVQGPREREAKAQGHGPRRRLSRGWYWTHVAVTGAYFGALQWSAFFLLQSYLASTATVYLLATLAWLGGSLAGLAAPGRAREGWWLAVSVSAYLFLFQWARAHPYELQWLPVLLVAVAGMGGYAGRFFRFRATGGEGSQRLFFTENTGFVAGMFLTVAILYRIGDRGLLLIPLAGAALCAVTRLGFRERRPDGMASGL